MKKQNARKFCESILPKVSRTFAINIAFLKGTVHHAVLVGYLMCRIADTVEDTKLLDASRQRVLLDEFVRIFRERDFTKETLKEWESNFKRFESNVPDHFLIQSSSVVFEHFLALPREYQDAVSDCVIEMSQGMRSYFQAGNQPDAKRLETMEDLDRYCYFVAGTVGKMLSRVFTLSSPRIKKDLSQGDRRLDISFGLGLQVTNIIKDCRQDFNERNWSYIPVQLVRDHGLGSIEELFDKRNVGKAVEVLDDLVLKALAHLDDAFDYSLSIPRRDVRLRIFCLQPLFFAAATLAVARANLDVVLAGETKVKITRAQVTDIIKKVSLCCWSNSMLKSYYTKLRDGVLHAR